MKPKVSIVVPFHWMDNWQYFLRRCLESIEMQSFKDYEVVLIKYSTMPVTSNRVIKSAQGEYVKVLYMDDFFTDEESLRMIMAHMRKSNAQWGICGVNNHQEPEWTDDLEAGNNKLGSPSALIFKNQEENELFDEHLSWLLDCDLYKRMEQKFGKPLIMIGDYITIGIHDGQMTNILTEDDKNGEAVYLRRKHG